MKTYVYGDHSNFEKTKSSCTSLSQNGPKEVINNVGYQLLSLHLSQKFAYLSNPFSLTTV